MSPGARGHRNQRVRARLRGLLPVAQGNDIAKDLAAIGVDRRDHRGGVSQRGDNPGNLARDCRRQVVFQPRGPFKDNVDAKGHTRRERREKLAIERGSSKVQERNCANSPRPSHRFQQRRIGDEEHPSDEDGVADAE